MTGTLTGLEPLRDANTTPALRRIAIRCGAAWPYRQAQETILELTGVQISHEQIRLLCSDEAQKVNAQEAEGYQKIYQKGLVETMETLVEYLSEKPNDEAERPPATPESERVYFGIDGTFVNEKESKAFLEAKAAIVFTNEIAVVGRKRRVLLNKRYTGTFEPVSVFSEKLFTTARAMGIDNQPELVILAKRAARLAKVAPRSRSLA